MTNYFAYEQLTWPEIDALPRNLPLILPLGNGYSLERLASALGEPQHAALLPAIPYGWSGSGLDVPGERLAAMVTRLIDSLREDGFTRVYALTPQGLDLGLGDARITLPHPSQFISQQPLPVDSERDKVVILMVGHIEQHGFHLPMSTDTMIIEAIGQGTARLAPEQAVCLPVMPYGVSTHRASFAGTLNCGGRAFEDFWVAVIDNLAERGFNRFYILNGHGGNSSFLVNVVKYAGERHKQIFCATSWLYLSGPKGSKVLEQYRESAIGGMGHACELETSLILYLCPELVRMERVVDELDFVTTPAYFMDWLEGGALVANPPWDDDTRTGAYGAGSLGTADKGRLWLEAAIAEKVDHVAEINQQYALRTARRANGFATKGTSNPYR
jgi:creatinine amidohydrolase